MKKVKLSNASRSLAQYTTELEDDIVIVTEGDRPLAALVPLKNVDRESLALSTHPEFLKLVGRARKDFTLGKVVSLDEMRSRVGRMRSPNSAFKLVFPWMVVAWFHQPQSFGVAAAVLSSATGGPYTGFVQADRFETITAMHVHGPAAVDENGPVLIELPLPVSGFAEFDIAASVEQVHLLQTQMCYVDVHTVEQPDGAIRGQVLPVAVTPSSWAAVKELYR